MVTTCMYVDTTELEINYLYMPIYSYAILMREIELRKKVVLPLFQVRLLLY